jgi:hypothetical protein
MGNVNKPASNPATGTGGFTVGPESRPSDAHIQSPDNPAGTPTGAGSGSH